MYPLMTTIHLIVVAAGAIGLLVHPGAASATPAMRFWEALPGTPVPEVIAQLIQQGIDHSPFEEHYPVTVNAGGDVAWHRCGGRCAEKAEGFFFRQTQARVGSTMTFSFRPALVPPILPQDVSEKVPFGDLATLLATFNVSPCSAEAAMVRDTLSQCQAFDDGDEQKACTTSLEGTVQSALRMFAGSGGTDSSGGGVLWAAASAIRSTGLPLRPYVIQAVTPLDGDRHVGCHIMPYPYAVYYCHMTGLPTKAYLVSVHSSVVSGGGPAPAVTLAALCHLDTSTWNPARPAFKMLHSHPGGEPICHFMPYANLLFGEKNP